MTGYKTVNKTLCDISPQSVATENVTDLSLLLLLLFDILLCVQFNMVRNMN